MKAEHGRGFRSKAFRCGIAVCVGVMLVGSVWAQALPPVVTGQQWSLVVLPDVQALNENYGESQGYVYDGRFDKEMQWVAANVGPLNIRFVAGMGDNVQRNGTDAGEWSRAVGGWNRLHVSQDPGLAALVPYASCIGNHDYDSSSWSDLTAHTFVANLGPTRFRDAQGNIRPTVQDWYMGDDNGWKWVVGGATLATGAGRNSWQKFSAGGREFLHLALECAVTDQGIAWAKSILDANRGLPTIVSTHAFVQVGAGRASFRTQNPNKGNNGMGREVNTGSNRTNNGQEIWDKFIKDYDQIFMVLCGHLFAQGRWRLTNTAGHDVHAFQACYHLQLGFGGRVIDAQKPAGGWPSGYTPSGLNDPDDIQRNGCTWLIVFVFDPANKVVTRYAYCPLLGVWAPNVSSYPSGHYTYPIAVASTDPSQFNCDVIEQFPLDFDARYGALVTANAGADCIAYESYTCSLDSSASTAATSYTWTQPRGKPVTLLNANPAHASFVTPVVTMPAEAQLRFRLAVNGPQ